MTKRSSVVKHCICRRIKAHNEHIRTIIQNTHIIKKIFIGKNVVLGVNSFISPGTHIGDNTVIAHGVMFINDLFANGGPANGDKSLWKYTNIGNNVSIGSNATILPINICDNVVIGAGSVVTKDIIEAGIYIGNPAKKIKDV